MRETDGRSNIVDTYRDSLLAGLSGRNKTKAIGTATMQSALDSCGA